MNNHNGYWRCKDCGAICMDILIENNRRWKRDGNLVFHLCNAEEEDWSVSWSASNYFEEIDN